MSVSLENVHAYFITMVNGGLTVGTDEGKAVKVSANKTVHLVGDGDTIFGAADHLTSSLVSVKRGFVTFEYTGTAPSVGFAPLKGSATAGKVQKGTAGTDPFYQIANVDTSAQTVTIFLP